MKMLGVLCLITVTGMLSACTTTRHAVDNEYKPPQGDYRMIVMQPDISVGVLTAGGAFELRQDWSEQSRKHVLNALTASQSKRGGETTVAATRAETGAEATLVADLVWLHTAVGAAVTAHKFGKQPLPTKKNRFDWTLGERAVEFGKTTQYDYALFLHAQDSFSSGGRVALQALALVGCGLGYCAMPTGGVQAAFASLVDLKTGKVVWFNTLASSVGDIRTQKGAETMVTKLLRTMDSASNKRRT